MSDRLSPREPATGEVCGAGPVRAVPGRERVDRSAERRVVQGGIAAAAAFLVAAVATWLSGIAGPGHWAPLHLALAGGATMAVGALLPHFSVSLAVARPVPARWRILGLALLGGGALLAVIAVSSGAPRAGAVGAAAFLGGLALTGLAAFLPVRGPLAGRFGVVRVAYGLALASVSAGVALALLDLAGVSPVVDGWARLEPAHAWLNLVGFLALVIAASLVHLLPTVVGTRIQPRRAMVVMTGGLAGGAALVALGYALDLPVLARAGAVTTLCGAAGVPLVVADALRPRGRWTTDLAWHRLATGHLWGSVAWLVIGLAIAAAAVIVRGSDPAGWSVDRVVGPIVVGCAAQVLVGAWTHLVPALGPGDMARHAVQRRILGRWPIGRLALINGGALLLSIGALARIAWAVEAGAAASAVAVVVALALLGRALWPGQG